MSIKPEYTRHIRSGAKRYEFRTRIFNTNRHQKAYIYSTSPEKLVIGWCQIKDVIVGSPSEIWRITHDFSGISENDYFEYFKDRSIAFALCLGQFVPLSFPRKLGDAFDLSRPPQSYAFVPDEIAG